jgi:hypothetical protein
MGRSFKEQREMAESLFEEVVLVTETHKKPKVNNSVE